MVVILKPHPDQKKVDQLAESFRSLGFSIHYSEGEHTIIMGLVGDTSRVDINTIAANEIVDRVQRISQPYKAANRRFHPQDTVIDVAGRRIGGGTFSVIAGPCSVESEEQIICVAEAIKASGAQFLRGGAFKPRTSPYAFQGLEADGLKLLLEAKKATGLPIVTEIMSQTHIDLFADVDVIQVGARNMQNFQLLKELGHSKKPILLKRGLANTIEELLMSAEYIMAGGNPNVILCERGIRTFETSMRNTPDLAAIPMIKHQSHLPVVFDPSHATGIPWMVEPLTKAALALGADGVMIEVHNNPGAALCDGAQSLNFEQFAQVMDTVKQRAPQEGKAL